MLSKTIISIYHINHLTIFILNCHLLLLLACIFYLILLLLLLQRLLLLYLNLNWLFDYFILIFDGIHVHILWLIVLNYLLLRLNGNLIVDWLVGSFIFIYITRFNRSLYALLAFKARSDLTIHRCFLILQGF